MDVNPYKAPKEDQRLTARTGAAVVVWGVLAIPAGCICGSATCYPVAMAGHAVAYSLGDYGHILASVVATLGLILGFVVFSLVFTRMQQWSTVVPKQNEPNDE